MYIQRVTFFDLGISQDREGQMIQVTNLSKRYDSTLALDQLTLKIPQGSVFGLLGPNGSGKSTFIKLLMGFIFPNGGEIAFEAPEQIGYLPERISFPDGTRLFEYLMILGELSGLKRKQLQHHVAVALQMVGLSENARWHIKACSKGMLQRLGFAQALLNDPPLLILDEPMSGLDPAWQQRMREIIRQQHELGKTILLSSHHLNEMAELCTDIAILNHGRLVRAGSLNEVLFVDPQVVITIASLPPELPKALLSLHPDIKIHYNYIILEGEVIPLQPDVLRILLDYKVNIVQLIQKRATLEDIYLEALNS
jgi:ABC-2 type transport system ATP-binding protein